MDKLKQWTALTLVAVLAVAAAGWFLLISPTRSEAAELREQAEAQVSSNSQLAQQLAVLQAKAADLPQQQAKLAAVSAKIPADVAMPSLIRALTAAGSATDVEFVSLVPSAPQPAVTPAAPAPVAASGDEAAAVAPTAPAATGLSVIPVTITVVGGFYEVQQYLMAIEDLPRALRVNNLQLTPGLSPVAGTAVGTEDKDGSSLVSVITGEVFMSAAAPAPVAAGVTPPAGTVTAPAQPAN